MNVGHLARQGLSNQLNNQQQTQQREIPEQLKQVADYVFEKLTLARPAWKNGFTNNGVLDTQQIIGYKTTLLEAMELEKINTYAKVKQGLNKLITQSGAFLPSVGDFVQACKSEKVSELNAAMYQEFRPNRLISSITEQERKATALNEIEKIKAMLKSAK